MANPPSHFFKFIPPGFKFNLSIPKSFLKNLNNGGREKATLRRGCREWIVYISDEGVFGDGWRKFVIENGVQEFDFIIFKHQGNMVFDFLVFDQSTCERHYPNLFDEMDVEQPLTESDSTHIHQRSKKFKNYSSQKQDEIRAGDDHFVITMTRHNIKSATLHVPMKFAQAHNLTNRMNTKVVLADETQRTWPAVLKKKSSGACLACWRVLKVNNYLKVGDVCMFKIVKNGEVPVFNFYRKEPVHRYFISTIKSYFKKTGMLLPTEFSIINGLKVGEMVIRDDKGRSWKVQLRRSNEKSFYLRYGIKDFCMENGLKEGDAFKFELVENEKDKPPTVNFSLIRDSTLSQEGKRHTSSGS